MKLEGNGARRLIAALLAGTCLAVLGAPEALAQQTWTGTAGTSWDNNGNWTPGPAPVAGTTVTIDNGALPNQPTVRFDQTAA